VRTTLFSWDEDPDNMVFFVFFCFFLFFFVFSGFACYRWGGEGAAAEGEGDVRMRHPKGPLAARIIAAEGARPKSFGLDT